MAIKQSPDNRNAMKRNLIIIGGGNLQLPLIQTARRMGLFTIVFDMDPEAAGMKEADLAVCMSTRDIEGCVREAKKLRQTMMVHGVITAGTDASRAVAAIAAALELPGIRYSSAEAASNKVLMRKTLRRHGVPVPDFYPVWSLKEARDALDELGCPAVLKPAENMGARGVIKIRSREELQSAYRHTKKYATTGELILEEYMEGPELSIDALAWNGQIAITGIADRIITREPYFIEIGHNMPSAMSPDILKEAEEVMKAGMRALGIHTGAGKGDLKVTPEGVMVGEIAARLSGGWMSSHTFPLHSGVDLYRAAIRIALGEEPGSLEPVQNFVCIERGILSSPGKIMAIEGIEAMRSVPGVEEVILTKSVGSVMQPVTSNIDKVGHVIVRARTLGEAEAAAEAAFSHLQITVDDTFSVDWKQVEQRARERLGDSICWVCRSCDGKNCASSVPGMGGAGSQASFIDNSVALAEYKIMPRYIREPVTPQVHLELFGRHLEHPVMIAPMTGASTNLGDAISEEDLARHLLQGARETGSIGWAGDGASINKYHRIYSVLRDLDGFGIVILKPRADTEALLRRIDEATESGFVAVGMDIDAITFRTLALRGQRGMARSFAAIEELCRRTTLPFVLKGIMSPDDARAAIDAGVSAIVVSNHGGRVHEDLPGTARVLPEIARVVDGRIPVLVDGGIRSGSDVFKMLCLGASAVLVGRPAVIAAVGGGLPAVKVLLQRYVSELRQSMELCGVSSLRDAGPMYLKRIREPGESSSASAGSSSKGRTRSISD
jgi:isopentenyl diphosphate isomerase/L-lactate dehydrogenase-like FMN-dependent dehydrogenase/biotin carboxylase